MNKEIIEINAQRAYGFALHAMPSAIAFNASVNYGATKFKFANFKAIRDAVLPVFAKHNLSVRYTSRKVDGDLHLVGEVFYKDGEVVNTFSLPLRASTKPQDMGSELTYFKRYALSALANVVTDEDDDGNFADKAEAERAISGEQVKALKQIIDTTNSNERAFLNAIKCSTLGEIPANKYDGAMAKLVNKQKQMAETNEEQA